MELHGEMQCDLGSLFLPIDIIVISRKQIFLSKHD